MGAICLTTDLCLTSASCQKSSTVERVVAEQLKEYLLTNDLMPRYQSAYQKKHPTETALLRVWSDMLNAAYSRQVTLLIHSCPIVHSKLPTEANCLQLDHCCLAFHKGPFWGHCCTFCTLPKSSMDAWHASYTNMLMTANFTFM